MDAIRIENLRSLSDTGLIELKPLTLLVGQNSSGKSSFLRFFPLLRQSMEARLVGPISWYGRLVDFGNIQDALKRNSEKDEITFQCRLVLQKPKSPKDMETRIILGSYLLEDLELSLILKIGETPESSCIKSCELSFADHRIKVEFDHSGKTTNLDNAIKVKKFQVNTLDVLSVPKQNYLGLEGKGSLLPEIIDKPLDSFEHRDNLDMLVFSKFFNHRSNLDVLVFSEIKKYVHASAKDKTITLIMSYLGIGSSDAMLENMKSNPKAVKTWKDNVASWTSDHIEFQKLRELIIARSTNRLFSIINEYFDQVGMNIRYIAPIRATASKYYQVENTALDEVDCRGENLPMFIKNFTPSEQEKFEEWTSKHFDFMVCASSSGGRISLNMKNNSGGEGFNLADTGFGYSQVLPMLTQLWILIKNIRLMRKIFSFAMIRVPTIFAIEQPELHLHPALQAKLADVFISAIKLAKENGIDLRLIIETHSEIIINRLGQRIANKEFTPENVNVVLFEKEPFELTTKVSISGYDENGFLKNWPLGFLEPDMI